MVPIETFANADEAANAALAYGMAQVNLMTICGIVILFPIARHFAVDEPGRPDVLKLVARSLFNIRALGLYFAIAGVTLCLPPRPVPHRRR